MCNKLYTLRVKSNVHKDLFLNTEGSLSFDENEKIAFDEKLKDYFHDHLAEGIVVTNLINHMFGTNPNLKVKLIFENANIDEYPIKTRKNSYVTKEQQISIWKRELKDLKDQRAKLNAEVENLQYKITVTQDHINTIDTNIKQLEMLK